MARIQGKSNGLKLKDKGLSNNKQRMDITQRLAGLEKAYMGLVKAVNESFNGVKAEATEIRGDVSTLDRISGALLEVLGEDTAKKVMENVKQRRIKELEAQSKQQSEEIAVMVAEGKLKSATSVTSENDIVVITEKTDKGELKYPEKAYAIVGQLEDGVKTLLIGKNVGETLTLPTGGTVVILGCFAVVEVATSGYCDTSTNFVGMNTVGTEAGADPAAEEMPIQADKAEVSE